VSGVAIRLMLGRGKSAWLPDLGLLGYTLAVSLLAAAPSLLAVMAQPPAHGAPAAAFSNYTAMAAGSVVASLAILWATLRLTLWPIGRLLGNVEVTASRSWKLMRGAVLRYAMALILLGAPVFILSVMVAMLTKPQGHLISQLAVTPLTSLAALLAAAVAAEVYRARVVVAP
jgi:hypothetical protein